MALTHLAHRRTGLLPAVSVLALSMVMAPAAFAQEQDEEDEVSVTSEDERGPEVQPQGEIIVTGTNIRGVQNPTVPIISFDREELQRSGFGTIEDFARTLPQNFTGALSPLTRNSGVEGANQDTALGTNFELRGLGAGSTLTLVDGRRIVDAGRSGAADISIIPLSLIERVDVATDGASAVYGTDAIGGVVNFIIRDDFDGLELNARASTIQGGKEDQQYNVTAGHNWSSGNAVFSVSLNFEEPLLYSERDFIIPPDDSLSAVSNPLGSFTPDQRLLSIYTSARQELSDSTEIRSKFIYADREAETFGRPGRRNDNESETLISSTQLTHSWSEDIETSVLVDYSRSTVDFTTILDDGGILQQVQDVNTFFASEFNISGRLPDTLPIDVRFAAGAFYEDENYRTGTRSVDLTQTSYGAYAEVLLGLVKEPTGMLESFDVSFAGRYQDYELFGDDFNPKVGAYLRTAFGLGLRGSYSESFRTPNLSDVGGTRTALFLFSPFFPTDRDFSSEADPATINQFGLNPGTSLYLAFGGANPTLTPETAEAINLGVEFEPQFVDGLRLGASWFNVQYDERIDNFLQVNETLQREEFDALIDRDPDPAIIQNVLDNPDNFFITDGLFLLPNPLTFQDISANNISFVVNNGFQNVNLVEVSGFDLFADYSTELGGGTFSLNVNGTILTQNDLKVTPTSNAADLLDVVFRPTDFDIRTTVFWSKNGLGLFGALNHVGGYTNDLVDPVEEIGSFTTFDLSISFDTNEAGVGGLLGGTRIILAANNLFDQDPPFVQDPSGLGLISTPQTRILSAELLACSS